MKSAYEAQPALRPKHDYWESEKPDAFGERRSAYQAKRIKRRAKGELER